MFTTLIDLLHRLEETFSKKPLVAPGLPASLPAAGGAPSAPRSWSSASSSLAAMPLPAEAPARPRRCTFTTRLGWEGGDGAGRARVPPTCRGDHR
eukprot:gene3135-biopygen14244